MALRHDRRLGALLIASLALNLFGIGLLAGSYLRPQLAGRDGPGPASLAPAAFEANELLVALPEAARPRAAEIIEAHAADLQAGLAALGPARLEVIAALGREPFDADAAAAALSALRDRALALQVTAHAIVTEVAGGLSEADRERFAQALFLRTVDGVPLAALARARPAG